MTRMRFSISESQSCQIVLALFFLLTLKIIQRSGKNAYCVGVWEEAPNVRMKFKSE